MPNGMPTVSWTTITLAADPDRQRATQHAAYQRFYTQYYNRIEGTDGTDRPLYTPAPFQRFDL